MWLRSLGCGALFLLLLAGSSAAAAPKAAAAPQTAVAPQSSTPAARQGELDRRFLRQRSAAPSTSAAHTAAESLLRARTGAAALHRATRAGAQAQPAGFSSTTWQSAGPAQLSTPAYGLVTGRVSSLAVDPNDPSGNTLYLGATGGGVWKSTNAATSGVAGFTPLTDDIQAFANSFTSIPSLSIGALTVQPGVPQVLLAGTGDPNDALDSYYGVGLLRSSDGGTSWTLIGSSSDDQHYSFRGAGFAGFAWSTTTANLVVAAVSQSLEGLLVNTQFTASAEMGLYYSTDAGQTWRLSTITDGTNKVLQSSSKNSAPPGNAVTSVVWNPKRGLFLAAVRFHGYYSSPDGVTWTRLASQPGSGLSTTVCPPEPGGTGSPSCPIFRGALAVQPTTGDTFALTTDINNADGGTDANGNALGGLYQDVCSSTGAAVSSCNTSSTFTFGTKINDSALDDPENPGTIAQADYNLALSAVASPGDTILLAGTEDVFRCSLANSCTWRNTTNNQTCAAAQVAPSTHSIAPAPTAAGLVYFGNDGGVWRSTDDVGQTGSVCSSADASHFQNLNGGLGSLAEISHFAVNGSNDSLVLAGMGEFGIVASESTQAQAGTGPWQQLLTGEGSYVAIDPSTPANWYADVGQGVGIFDCADGSSCNASSFGGQPAIDRTQVEDDTDAFVDPAPWILDPGNPANILLGTCRMWLGPATGGWSAGNLISTMLDGDQGPYCNNNAQLRSVAAGGSYNSPAGGEQMYAGMAGPLDGGSTYAGHLFGATVPQTGGVVSWTDLWRNPVTNGGAAAGAANFNPYSYAVSSIAVDPHDTTGKTVYAGIGGFGPTGILYGSIDGGAHWANITNSLPLAPINSVVVDPNNSADVYVGGDFGVYYTTNIASCADSSQNCWSELGSGLPNAPVTGLAVLSSGGSTVLEASTYGRGIWTLGLSTASTLAQATLSPGNYTFAPAGVGSPSASSASFTLANTGANALIIAAVTTAPTSDYSETNNCGTTLAAGASCTIQVTFTPSATGDRPGSLTVRANVSGGTLSSTLDGNGLTPGAISVSPASLNFPATVTATSSSPITVQVSNTGGAPVTLGAPTFAGANASDFHLSSSTCGSTLGAQTSCSLSVVFAPAAAGAHAAQLQLTGSAPGSPYTLNLMGSGVAPAALTISPSSLTFTAVPVQSVSEPLSLQVMNTGGAGAQLGTATVSGDFRISANGCGSVLAGGASCSVSIESTPTATGSRSGLFTLPSSSVSNGQVTAPLNGTGTATALSPASLNFAAQQQGTTSTAQTIYVTNTGQNAAQIGRASASGDFAVATNTCPASLAAGAQCALGMTFTPATTGARSGTLSQPFNAGILTAALSGTGNAPGLLTLSPSSLSFPVTADNATSAAQSVSVTNNGNSPALLSSITVSNPFAIASNSCPAPPATLAVNAQCTLSFTFSPTGVVNYSGGATIAGNFSNAPATISMTGQGASPPSATVSPTSLSFPDTPQGSVSAAQNVTVSSTGGVAVTLSAPTISQNFQIASDPCPSSLAPGNSCTISILFHPGSTGALTGTFTQPGNMVGGPLSVALGGKGLQPGAIALAPSTVQFGSVVVGTPSTPQTVMVSNSGQTSVALGTPTVNNDYALTGSTCGATLGGGQSCSLTVQFTPTVAGARPGQLTIPGSGGGPTAVATLEGTGITPGSLALSPSSQAFGTVAIGSSASATLTATNSGGAAVHPSAISAGGDFAVTGGTCTVGGAIAPNGGTCTVIVTFTPAASGSRSAQLTITSDGTPGTVQAGLAGVGALPGNLSLSPASYQFGPVVVGTVSAQQSFTASNSGGVAVSLGPASVSGSEYKIGANSCGSSLGPNATCSVQVTFAPTAQGDTPGTLSLPNTGNGSTATASLDGRGVTPGMLTLTPSPAAFGSVVVNTSATVAVTVQNTGGAPVPLGTPSATSGFSVASQCAGVLAPNASCTVQVTFSPTGAGSVSGLLTVPSSGSGTGATDTLSGAGVLPGSLTAAPSTLTFGFTVVGGQSASQTATIANPGGVSVSITAPQLSSADYSITGSNCGASLAPMTSCSVSVAFTPTAAGSRAATLTVASSDGSGAVARVSLSGSGLAPAQLTFAPSSLTFGGQDLRTTSSSQTLKLSNTGEVATGLSLPVLAGAYAITANSCGTTLSAGGSCAIAVQFAPTSAGSQNGSLTVASITGTPAATALLSGTGLALVANPTSLVFQPALPVGASETSPQLINIANLGTVGVTLQPFIITGDFAAGNSSCTGTLGPDSSCAIYVIFTPTAGGKRTGTFTVSDGTETDVVQLLGTGLSQATDTLSASSLAFGTTVVGQTSGSQVVTLTNSGDATLANITATTSGPFLATNNCGNSLGGHLSCTIAVSFAPSAVGSANGGLAVSDAQRTQSLQLSGEGAPPPTAFSSPASLTFGGYALSLATPPQSATISNGGTTAIMNPSITITGSDFTIVSSTCGSTIAPAATCQVNVVFTPSAVGMRQGVLNVSSSSLAVPLSVALSGSGEDFQLSAVGTTTGVVTVGQTASYQFMVTPTGASAGTLAITCSGAPANSVCTVNPASMTLASGVSGSLMVTVATQTATAAAALHRWQKWAGETALALLCPLILLPRRYRQRLLMVLLAAGLLGLPIGCGVHASGVNTPGGPTPPGQTPSGSYTITVNAAFPGATRTATVTLVVQ